MGAIELGEAVIEACKEDNPFKFLYEDNLSVKEKIETIAKEMYGAKDVEVRLNFSPLSSFLFYSLSESDS